MVKKTFSPKNKDEWRQWLRQNHKSEESVWLVYYKKGSGIPAETRRKRIDGILGLAEQGSQIKGA